MRRALVVDATNAVEVMDQVPGAHRGAICRSDVNCVSVPNTEMGTILARAAGRDGTLLLDGDPLHLGSARGRRSRQRRDDDHRQRLRAGPRGADAAAAAQRAEAFESCSKSDTSRHSLTTSSHVSDRQLSKLPGARAGSASLANHDDAANTAKSPGRCFHFAKAAV